MSRAIPPLALRHNPNRFLGGSSIFTLLSSASSSRATTTTTAHSLENTGWLAHNFAVYRALAIIVWLQLTPSAFWAREVAMRVSVLLCIYHQSWEILNHVLQLIDLTIDHMQPKAIDERRLLMRARSRICRRTGQLSPRMHRRRLPLWHL